MRNPTRVNADPNQTLLAELKGGDDFALNRLIERWEKPLFAFAWRYVRNRADAQDFVAETFVRLYQNRSRFRPNTNLSAWLFTTLANLCHNLHRWRRRHPSESMEALGHGETETMSEPVEACPAPDASLEHEELVAELGSALDRLPHDLKTALLLHYFEHLSYREIAAVVGCSERGVETRLYRARRQLRTDLEACLNEMAASP